MNTGMTVVGAMLTDTGLSRSNNEDSLGFVIPRIDDPQSARGVLAVVADGMGGHAAGEIASTLTVEVLIRTYYAADGTIPDALRAGFVSANQIVHTHSLKNPTYHGMGSTCTAVAIQNDRLFLAHVGDSRAYLLRGGQLVQLSEDDSLVLALLRSGAITATEVEHHPSRNVILKALGIAPTIDPLIWSDGMPLHHEDRLVLCSDGLNDMLGDEIIANLTGKTDPARACRALVSAALSAGGYDNVAVGVFHVMQAPISRRSPPPTRSSAAVAGEIQ